MNDSEFDWKAWRQEERRRLIGARKALTEDDRRARNGAIDALLGAGFAAFSGSVVGFCWPIAAEPEPRFAVRRWREQGSRAALPAVVKPRTPLEFREWWPGAPTQKGVYDIPYPVGTEVLEPEAALVPVNGFDGGAYRLGYGGGFFDRTLAALPRKPICIGLGYEIARLQTIHSQPHDVPFDFIITEAGIHVSVDGGLERIEPTEADA
ncbi:MAG: 5-formyltetrahydrofolate cyclo-ligase, partial [Halofilum sp. (in: g-proteobacteria)]